MIRKGAVIGLFVVLLLVSVSVGMASAADWSVSIDSLAAGDHDTAVSSLDWSFTGPTDNVSSCWYSVDSGATNVSTICGDLTVALASMEFDNTWEFYANDTDGNVSSDSVAFWVDSLFPIMSLLTPSVSESYTTFTFFDLVALLDEVL